MSSRIMRRQVFSGVLRQTMTASTRTSVHLRACTCTRSGACFVLCFRAAALTLFPIPYSLFPIPYTLHPIPYTLYPIPYTLDPIPYTLYTFLPYALFSKQGYAGDQ